MVTWNEGTPDGTKSVSVNTPKMLENTAYTKAKLGLDHYWSSGDDTKDGYHKYAQMTENGGATPVDPTLGASMNGIYYSKRKVVAEATDAAALTAQPFYLNGATSVMQMLGIRAMVLFDIDTTTYAITTKYSHNVKTIAASGVVRDAAGLFTITFINALPTANYFVMGGGFANTGPGVGSPSSPVTFSTGSFNDRTTSKTTALCKIIAKGSVITDPFQVWVIMFGG